DSLEAHEMADSTDCFHHGIVDRISGHVLYKATVDLQIIHRQVFQISERGQAATEIIQGETAALFFEPRDEIHRSREIRDDGGFGDLKTDLRRGGTCLIQLLNHKVEQLYV